MKNRKESKGMVYLFHYLHRNPCMAMLGTLPQDCEEMLIPSFCFQQSGSPYNYGSKKSGNSFCFTNLGLQMSDLPAL